MLGGELTAEEKKEVVTVAKGLAAQIRLMKEDYRKSWDYQDCKKYRDGCAAMARAARSLDSISFDE